MNSISPNLNIMIKACEKASKILIRDFGEVEKLQVSLKGPNNFVTNADRKVEQIIIEELEPIQNTKVNCDTDNLTKLEVKKCEMEARLLELKY